MTWVSVHAFHHGNLDPLLLGGVRPLVDALRRRGLVGAFFFLRYWDGGPHLRVRLRARGHPRPVEAEALRSLRSYLAEHPAPDSPLHGYAELAAGHARAEGLASYLREPLASNTVHAIAYRPEIERYGGGRALAAAERHFAESSRIALGLVAAGTTRDQRHTVALAAVLLTRHAFTPAGAVAAAPGRAASGATAGPTTGPTARPAFEAAGGASWTATAGRAAGQADRAFEAGYRAARERVRAVADEAARVADGTSALPAAGSLSAWWRSVTALRDGLRAAGTSVRDAARIGDTCAHLLCNRLGLTLTDESYVRYLAARAGER